MIRRFWIQVFREAGITSDGGASDGAIPSDADASGDAASPNDGDANPNAFCASPSADGANARARGGPSELVRA
jgi:hypothetical protein